MNRGSEVPAVFHLYPALPASVFNFTYLEYLIYLFRPAEKSVTYPPEGFIFNTDRVELPVELFSYCTLFLRLILISSPHLRTGLLQSVLSLKIWTLIGVNRGRDLPNSKVLETTAFLRKRTQLLEKHYGSIYIY